MDEAADELERLLLDIEQNGACGVYHTADGPAFGRPLRSLAAHNAERRAAHAALREPSPNGCACPLCGAELRDDPDAVLCSDPPQVRVRCPDPRCGFAGARVL